jgi:RHS repeat-associated protein
VRVVSNQTPATSNSTTHYVWNIFGQIIAEADGATGNTLRETVYMDGMPLVAVDAVAAPKKLYAVHVDHLNRPIMLTDAGKINVWWASYEPFGKVRATGGALTQNLGLPGQWFQLETGLAYNWHRHYDPTIGRYTTADPLGFVDGPSVYAYAGNRPHMVTDHNGLFGWVPFVAAAGVASLWPDSANAPGPGSEIKPATPLQPYVAGAVAGAVGAAGVCVRPYFDPRSSVYAPGTWMNSGQNWRLGRGRDGSREKFRAAGEWVERSTGQKHIDFKDLGPWSKR